MKDWVRLVSWLDGGLGTTAVDNACSSVCLGTVGPTSGLIVEDTVRLLGLFLRTSLVPSSWNLYRSWPKPTHSRPSRWHLKHFDVEDVSH